MNLLKRHLNDLHHVNSELYKSSGNNYYEGVADGYDMAIQLVEEYEKRSVTASIEPDYGFVDHD